MKGKFGIAALLLSSITFAGPVSTPNNVNDTPIISGGGSVSGGGTCRAYSNDGTAVPLSGGETLVFYGGGSGAAGGYLSTKTTYSGPAYLKIRKSYVDLGLVSRGGFGWLIYGGFVGNRNGSGIGLFARDTTNINDFIAGAGGSFGGFISKVDECHGFEFGEAGLYSTHASGGGWMGEGSLVYFFRRCDLLSTSSLYKSAGGTIYSGYWFGTLGASQGFHGAESGGAASSISAFYNSYTRDYTSVGTSLTITGGGAPGVDTPVLYVCQ